MDDTSSQQTRTGSIGFVSLGCAKNLVDTQIMAGVLQDEHVPLAPSPEAADVILVNTCAFIEDARSEACEHIAWACERKRTGGCRAVVVTGCLTQRYRERLFEAFPGVDAILGLDELEEVGDVLKRLAAGERGIARVSGRARRLFRPRNPRLVFSGGPYAYLKVAEGCNHRCAFCAIPAIRGPYRSRPLDELFEEARGLVDTGFREIDLISQDTSAYGSDRRGDNLSLAGLLRRLDGIDGDFWWRILYAYPAHIHEDLLEAMADSRHGCRYLDVPIQHSHPDMLRAMRRADTIASLPGLTGRLRRALPGAALRSTCLVGFPGETEAHFEHLLRALDAFDFDHLGVFVFSPEEGTPAFDLPDVPPLEVAEERRAEILRRQQQRVRRRMRALKGNRLRVLVEDPPGAGKSRRGGRSEGQAPEVDGRVLLGGLPDAVPAGTFVSARAEGFRGYNVLARFEPNPGTPWTS